MEAGGACAKASGNSSVQIMEGKGMNPTDPTWSKGAGESGECRERILQQAGGLVGLNEEVR